MYNMLGALYAFNTAWLHDYPPGPLVDNTGEDSCVASGLD